MPDSRLTDEMIDITGHCKRNDHHRCDGVLHAATGAHWFCACSCHPEPTAADCSTRASAASVAGALATWRLARSSAAATEETR